MDEWTEMKIAKRLKSMDNLALVKRFRDTYRDECYRSMCTDVLDFLTDVLTDWGCSKP